MTNQNKIKFNREINYGFLGAEGWSETEAPFFGYYTDADGYEVTIIVHRFGVSYYYIKELSDGLYEQFYYDNFLRDINGSAVVADLEMLDFEKYLTEVKATFEKNEL